MHGENCTCTWFQRTLFIVVLFCTCCGLVVVQGRDIILRNRHMRLVFDEETFGLKSLHATPNTTATILPVQADWNFMNSTSKPFPTWSCELRDSQGLGIVIDGNSNCDRRYFKQYISSEKTILEFHWLNVVVQKPTFLNVTVTVTVFDNEPLSRWRLLLENRMQNVTLWEVHFVTLHSLGSNASDFDQLFIPRELGVMLKTPHTQSINWRYPGGPMAMQFALFSHQFNTSANISITRSSYQNAIGLFYGALDTKANVKNFVWHPEVNGSTMYWVIYPEEMTLPIKQKVFALNYDIVIGPYFGDFWDGAQLYKKWAISNAPWLRKGKLSHREDVPKWYTNITLWVNTHWQPNVLNSTFGDPNLVQDYVVSFLKILFNLQNRTSPISYSNFGPQNIALHWYTWHHVPWGTNFPNFLPSKSNFTAVVQSLKRYGIKIFPYINARVYDIDNETWIRDDGVLYATKMSSPRAQPFNFPPYLESYDTGILWAVMCPFTKFWQEKLNDIVVALAKTYQTSGVYLDQLASKDPVLCFDQRHQHSLGGGSYWAEGYNKLLRTLRHSVSIDYPLVSESNGEVYIENILGFLSLGGYELCVMTPLFQTVYSEYAVTFGRYFSHDTISRNNTKFTRELAQVIFVL
jgi:hypothetical protein